MATSLQFLLFVGCLFGSSLGAVEIIQNGTYILEYNLLPNDTLSVTATVRTLGWVGVGLSETADMTAADLVMGGVSNGNSYIDDYSSTRNSRPIPDSHNDILTYSISENATHTTMHFTRLADTGDEFEDVPLSRATHIIWAYNADSDNPASGYHGSTNRGSIVLNQ